ncbi:hypothetical protein CAPTEDRAFT_79706, partial [Capitella teleta]
PDAWIQVDLAALQSLTAVVTRGRVVYPQFIKTYKLAHSQDGSSWSWYTDLNGDTKLHCFQIFEGNYDQGERVLNCLDPPIVTRFLRLYP